jgi:glutaminyl-tRNA synthetase
MTAEIPTSNRDASGDGPGNFVADIVDADLREGKHGGRVATRFPPEPNGYLHIGHAKSICLNFGIAAKAPGGVCNLRFDDTNPAAEEVEYVEAIKRDIRWLGFDWGEREYCASDYFDQLYQWAEQLISDGKAYVDSQTLEEIRKNRGDFHTPGVDSPHRSRSVDENLDLFRRMRAGEFADGSHVLRAKIDMKSTDLKLRDPILYRIRKEHHWRTGDKWCIYPMYDWAHGQSDAIEGITHSLCSLEFQNHRPLYDWFLQTLRIEPRPRQIEFARLNLGYTVLSKRFNKELVESKRVSGWDDPRMPTIAGMRRRGYTPEAIRAFCDRIGVSRRDGLVDVSLLEHAIREDLNARSPRALGVLRPLEITLENFEEGRVEWVDAPYHPERAEAGSRKLPLSRVVYVERDDFMEEAAKKWFRLAPGREVRLRFGCLITCREVVKDEAGQVIELRCTWDPDSLGGTPKDGRKVKGTLHWVSAAHAHPAEVRLYDRLFKVENPMDVPAGGHFRDHLNADSLEVLANAKVEPSLATAEPFARWQLERMGYYCVDPDTSKDKLVLNRTIGLADSWAKIAGKAEAGR